MEVAEKIKLLRSAKGYTQKEFSELLKIGYSSMQNYEQSSRGSYRILPKLCNKFPEYTLWLMINNTNIEQIKPTIKNKRGKK